MLKTVKVPKQYEAVFKRAEKIVRLFFKTREVDVSKATIKISDERYLLVRASSLSIDFFKCALDLFNHKEHDESIQMTRQLLFDLSHAIGMKDAEHFQKEMHLVDPIDTLSAGPVHFAYTGWASVTISPKSHPSADEDFLLLYDHPFSFEADSWIKAGEKSEIPVCIMNAGYSSGWCEQSFGIPLVATEITCRARGDKECHFIMAPPSQIENYLKDHLKQNPDLLKNPEDFEIHGFFKLKRIEADLREANAKLSESNKQLVLKSKALEEKTRVIELLSEMGELLPTCTTNEEIYSVFYEYASKLFPNFQGRLWMFNEDKSHLQTISMWGDIPKHQELFFNPSDCLALRKGQMYIVQSSSKGPWCHHTQKGCGGYICAPIATNGEVFGLISIVFGQSEFSQAEQTIVSRIAGDVALSLANIQLRESLRELSIRDYLTDLYNRRYMEEMLIKEIAQAKREHSPIGLIMFDIDYFKKFNDTYGHEAGDKILRELGSFLKDFFRAGDIICRFGGEEFLIILPGATQKHTLERAETLRKSVKHLHVKSDKVTISIGIAMFPENGETVRSLLDTVDKALYRSKEGGRDRTSISTTP